MTYSRQINKGTPMKFAIAIAIFAAVVAAAGLSPAAHADGDAAAGKRVFTRCAICHTTTPGKNGLGPTLFSVVGRHSASIEGFPYSAAMKAANKTWDEATLDIYLTSPKSLVPGTKMVFPGLPKPEDRANVIAYLSTLK
jgi:cytochrome c